MNSARIVLASASPRRKALLEELRVSCEQVSPDIDEQVLPAESPIDYVRRLAIGKAQTGWAIKGKALNLPTLGSDTTVVCDGEILGKPVNKEDALRMLRLLSNRSHEVHTAVACVTGDKTESVVVTTKVTFAALDNDLIQRYCQT